MADNKSHGTPVTGSPTITVLNAPVGTCVTLPRYCEIVGLDECAFYGVYYTGQEDYGCGTIWNYRDRNMIADYLAEAQEEIEQVVGFKLCPTWTTDEYHPYTIPVISTWKKVIAAGVQASSDIELGAAVSYVNEPASVGPIATTLTDTTEIVVYYPGTSTQIIPSEVTISGGFLNIYIPRCRLVEASLVNNDNNGLDYDDLGNFQVTVDVKRVYNDDSTQATLVWPHQCNSGSCSTCSCSEYTHDGCMYIKHGEMGVIDVLMADYSAGVWTTNCLGNCLTGAPSIVRLNYYSGMTPLTRQAESAIVRLAHSKMPRNPCAKCDSAANAWARDTKVPEILTAQRLNCPFGPSDGAFTAYHFARMMAIGRASVL